MYGKWINMVDIVVLGSTRKKFNTFFFYSWEMHIICKQMFLSYTITESSATAGTQRDLISSYHFAMRFSSCRIHRSQQTIFFIFFILIVIKKLLSFNISMERRIRVILYTRFVLKIKMKSNNENNDEWKEKKDLLAVARIVKPLMQNLY